ncbi:MAG TPA: DUF3300 domain-containing protein [Vicinamibacterales bacterium]|jgi:hypothetical protein
MTLRIFAATSLLFVACSSPHGEAAARAQAAQLPTGTLDQLLAPIALYPDSLLAQMLMSAQDPASVMKLDQWLKSNTNLKGSQLQDAAVKAGFEASFVALAIFPEVVARMSQQIKWTTELGQAFTNDRSGVFASIQRLRKQAKDVGTLKSTPQQDVETKTTSSGEQVIVIEPTNPQIVYVPQYNTQVVYTQPPATTVVVQDNSPDVAVAAGLIGFTAGIAIGAAMDNNYYYGPYGWRGGAYMYNDGWDDYWDHREDARDDWMDHREDLNENRSERLENTQENRTDRRNTTQEQRTDRQQNRQENRPATGAQGLGQAQGTAQTQRANRQGSAEARGYGEGSRSTQSTPQRSTSGARSDAFSGYSSGASQRSSSARGQSSRGSAASRGGGGRRR